MKLFFLLALAPITFLPLRAVEVGSTLDEVIAEKGAPSSRMQARDTLVLNYPEATIKLREGKVISVKAVESETRARTVITTPAGEWGTNYVSALTQAQEENRRILLFFTGSDWCGWCKRLDREVLSTDEFRGYAQKNLVLVKLDFPRQTPQSPSLKEQNEKLQAKYQIAGYPTIVVLDRQGKTLGTLGYEEGGARPFIERLKKL